MALLAVAVSTGCATTALEKETPATTNLAPMELPEPADRRFHQIDKLTNSETHFEFTDFNADGSYTGRRDTQGCSWQSSQLFFAPATSWKGCGDNPQWTNGENQNMTQDGELWPLEVGKKQTHRYTQVDAKGESSGKKARTCTVVSQVNLDVPAGNFDAYKVSCRRQDGNWWQTNVWYISPELQASVKYVKRSSSKGLETDEELVRIEAL